ncbi:hypothetical protein [Streptosporangium longisporum]|uniref:Uncharacterized protein n=1 Tax=Streptosporangium longisporum TaxID=46187 RepID=A0ABP6L385_9ACTN
MAAVIYLACEEHLEGPRCDDDEVFVGVETVAAARVLWAAKHPGRKDTKIGRVVIGCDIGGCARQIYVKTVSITEARIITSGHDFAWYVARRAGGRLVDGCQFHLGTCCIQHASRSWIEGQPHPTLDPAAVLPGEPGFLGRPVAQLDLFTTEEP